MKRSRHHFRNLDADRRAPEQLTLLKLLRRRTPDVIYRLDPVPRNFPKPTNQKTTHENT